MDLKKLFMNDKAVSPVIGVVLMVAITVILAAAIGSSVFGQGTAEPAPKANINAKIVNGNTLVIEHLGGDTLVWDNTQIRFTYEDGSIGDKDITDPYELLNVTDDGIIEVVYPVDVDDYNPEIHNDVDDQFYVGDIVNFVIIDDEDDDISDKLPTGRVLNLKITDKVSNQLICDKTLRT
ncbi:MAG: type IV pilin N-terminal domain-containing protein [Methanosarcina mazei]